jgi:hypothetical protein
MDIAKFISERALRQHPVYSGRRGPPKMFPPNEHVRVAFPRNLYSILAAEAETDGVEVSDFVVEATIQRILRLPAERARARARKAIPNTCKRQAKSELL